jgi:predicted nuclease of predicted toxin-antitoxin system
VRLLLDEHISPKIAGWTADLGIYAQSVPHIGLSGASDPSLWTYAFENDLTVVTTNARDFVELLNVELHPGLIVLREGGLSRQAQWDRLRPALEHLLSTGDPDYMINRVIEVWGVGQFDVRSVPEA